MSDIDDLIKSYLGESPFRACLGALRDIGITDPDELCEALISCAAHGVGERAAAWDDMNEVTKGKEAFETRVPATSGWSGPRAFSSIARARL